jgi:hypothetical protein
MKKLNLAIAEQGNAFMQALMYGILKWPIRRNHTVFVAVNTKVLCSLSLAEGDAVEIIVYDPTNKEDPFELQLYEPLPTNLKEMHAYAKLLNISATKAMSLVNYNSNTDKIHSFVDFFHSYHSYMFRHHIKKLIQKEEYASASKS